MGTMVIVVIVLIVMMVGAADMALKCATYERSNGSCYYDSRLPFGDYYTPINPSSSYHSIMSCRGNRICVADPSKPNDDDEFICTGESGCDAIDATSSSFSSSFSYTPSYSYAYSSYSY